MLSASGVATLWRYISLIITIIIIITITHRTEQLQRANMEIRCTL